MVHFFRLVRWQNLVIIIFTMCVIRYGVIASLVESHGFSLVLDNIDFSMLVLATLLMAASGYIINDYFDVSTDSINKPDQIIIDRHISRKTALFIHICFNVLALIIAFYYSFKIELPKLGLVFVIISGLLYFYSESFKRILLVGNIVVAVLTAMVPFIIFLYEIPPVIAQNKIQMVIGQVSLNDVGWWVLFFSVFAFLITLIREIIKDAEDFEGDRLSGYDTLPVAMGIKVTRIILVILCLAMIALLTYVHFTYLQDPVSFVYIFGLIVAPLAFAGYKIMNASKKEDYHFLSILCKLIMITGTLYGFVAHYLIKFGNA